MSSSSLIKYMKYMADECDPDYYPFGKAAALLERAEWLLTIAGEPLVRDMDSRDWAAATGDWFLDLYNVENREYLELGSIHEHDYARVDDE